MSFMLYNAPQSTCSQRVRFVLNAKQLPFAETKLDLLEGDQLKPEYLKINPNGVVPTLDHDGDIVIDSTVIIEYLDEVFLEPGEFYAVRSAPARRDAFADALFRRGASGSGSRPDLQHRISAALCGDERGRVSRIRQLETAAQGVHAGDGPHRLCRRKIWMRRWSE